MAPGFAIWGYIVEGSQSAKPGGGSHDRWPLKVDASIAPTDARKAARADGKSRGFGASGRNCRATGGAAAGRAGNRPRLGCGARLLDHAQLLEGVLADVLDLAFVATRRGAGDGRAERAHRR